MSDTPCMLLTARLSPGFASSVFSKLYFDYLSFIYRAPWCHEAFKQGGFCTLAQWTVYFKFHWPATDKSHRRLAGGRCQFPHCPDSVGTQRWTETSSCGETSFTQPLQLPVHWLTWAPGREEHHQTHFDWTFPLKTPYSVLTILLDWRQKFKQSWKNI